jgi:DNA-binding XRE family transcriptional regulator
MASVLVRNADRMMTAADARPEGIVVTFADGYRGLIPFEALPEIGSLSKLEEVDLPNPYQMVLQATGGDTIEIPWDFARHYCDARYRPHAEQMAHRGQAAVGRRIRRLREAAGMTQESLAEAAGIGRVTLVRIERGEQSPRYGTLVRLAAALGEAPAALLTDD